MQDFEKQAISLDTYRKMLNFQAALVTVFSIYVVFVENLFTYL